MHLTQIDQGIEWSRAIFPVKLKLRHGRNEPTDVIHQNIWPCDCHSRGYEKARVRDSTRGLRQVLNFMWVFPILTTDFPDHQYQYPFLHSGHPKHNMPIMATVARTTTERSSERMDIHRSDAWQGGDTKRSPDGHDKKQFFQDGLNTGAHIRGKWSSDDIHLILPHVNHVLS